MRDAAGRRLVAVNGLGGLDHLWDAFRAALRPGTDLVVLDLPSHGDRPAAADYRYAAMAEDVAERTAGLPPFPLLGWSVGAAVGWLFAAAHPDRVTSLVLIEPAAPHQSRFLQGPAPPPVHPYTFASAAEAAGVLRGIDPTVDEADVRAGYRENGEGRLEPRFDPAIFPVLVEDGRERGAAILDALRSIEVPVLVLRGERSLLTEAQASEIAGTAPRGRLEKVPGAGHFLLREQPEPAARLIMSFIGGM